MKFYFRTKPTVAVHGFTPEDPTAILEQVNRGAKPSSLKGDFILVAEGEEASSGAPLTVFVSTVISAIPYFYHVGKGRCHHAPNVFECCRAAGLGWEWDWQSLAEISIFDHLLGNRSLHSAIRRVPAASVVVVQDGKVEQQSEPFWQELYSSGSYRSLVAEAGDLVSELVSELPAYLPLALSLSAGYDSRVLLAALIRLGRQAQVASQGSPGATDPRIAEQLARAVGFPFQRVDIAPSDYPAQAERILTATSGEKSFQHWHTGIYARQVEFREGCLHLAGSNGEFARSSLFDKGMVASLLDTFRVPGWDRWLTRQYGVSRRIDPAVAAAFQPGSQFAARLGTEAMVRAIYEPGYRFGDGLDMFYARQRVRNFIGLGIALYRTRFATTSPFLDARFVRYAAGLPRREKLANNLPRSIIGQLQPALLDFPTDESGVPMKAEPPLLYFRQRSTVKGYQRYREAQRLPEVAAWAEAGFRELGGDGARLGNDARLRAKVGQWNFGITVGAALDCIKQRGIPIKPSSA